MTTPDRQERFSSLVEAHRRLLYKVCSSYCAQPEDRNDLAQEILVELWKSFERYDEQYRFSTWMYRIAINVAISFYRQRTSRTRHTVEVEEERLLDVADPSSPAEASEDLQLVNRFIGRLDDLDKALVLLYLDGNDYRTIAGILGISETNVATKLSRIKKKLREDFAGARG